MIVLGTAEVVFVFERKTDGLVEVLELFERLCETPRVQRMMLILRCTSAASAATNLGRFEEYRILATTECFAYPAAPILLIVIAISRNE